MKKKRNKRKEMRSQETENNYQPNLIICHPSQIEFYRKVFERKKGE